MFFFKCANPEKSKHFCIHCYLSSRFHETFHLSVSRVCGSQADPFAADLFCSQIFITHSSIFSSPPSSYRQLWQTQPWRLFSAHSLLWSCEKTQESTCLIIQEKSSLGSKLCNFKSPHVGKIKCEVITQVSFCCAAVGRRKKNNPPTVPIMLLTVMCSSLKKLINMREVFFSNLPEDEGQGDRNLRNVSIIYNILQGEISTCWDPSL